MNDATSLNQIDLPMTTGITIGDKSGTPSTPLEATEIKGNSCFNPQPLSFIAKQALDKGCSASINL